MKSTKTRTSRASALKVRRRSQNTLRPVKSGFCPNPSAVTSPRALSSEQRDLLRFSRKASSASGDNLGKYRVVAQFIRIHRDQLRKTENKLLVAGGFCKSAASEIVKIALHAPDEIFRQWLEGDIGFRIILRAANSAKTAKLNGSSKKKLPKKRSK